MQSAWPALWSHLYWGVKLYPNLYSVSEAKCIPMDLLAGPTAAAPEVDLRLDSACRANHLASNLTETQKETWKVLAHFALKVDSVQ